MLMYYAKRRTANQLADWRIYRGFTQADLGRAVGVSATTVRAWEAGTTIPTPAHAAKLARVLHCSQQDLFTPLV
jgi:DNA-binding XRE family transcriptional regulator